MMTRPTPDQIVSLGVRVRSRPGIAVDLLIALSDLYELVADFRQDFPRRHTAHGQQTLGQAVGALADALGEDPQEVQEAYERSCALSLPRRHRS